MSDASKQAYEQWPSTYIAIFGCSGPQCQLKCGLMISSLSQLCILILTPPNSRGNVHGVMMAFVLPVMCANSFLVVLFQCFSLFFPLFSHTHSLQEHSFIHSSSYLFIQLVNVWLPLYAITHSYSIYIFQHLVPTFRVSIQRRKPDIALSKYAILLFTMTLSPFDESSCVKAFL